MSLPQCSPPWSTAASASVKQSQRSWYTVFMDIYFQDIRSQEPGHLPRWIHPLGMVDCSLGSYPSLLREGWMTLYYFNNQIICNLMDKERVIGFHYLGPNAGEVTQVCFNTFWVSVVIYIYFVIWYPRDLEPDSSLEWRRRILIVSLESIPFVPKKWWPSRLVWFKPPLYTSDNKGQRSQSPQDWLLRLSRPSAAGTFIHPTNNFSLLGFGMVLATLGGERPVWILSI